MDATRGKPELNAALSLVFSLRLDKLKKRSQKAFITLQVLHRNVADVAVHHLSRNAGRR
jgi:hypothetical protein